MVRREARGVNAAQSEEHAAVSADSMERIDAPIGHAFVVPVDPVLLKGMISSGAAPRLLLDDGLELPSQLYRVSITPRADAGEGPWGRWLGASIQWDSRAISTQDARALLAEEDPGVGFALLVEPKVGRNDNAVWLGSDRVPMQWLPSVESMTKSDASLAEGPWTSPLQPAASGQGQVRAAIEHEARSPLTRWRAKLLLAGLREGVNPPGVGPLDDPLLEAMADQQEQRWRVALARLWTTDKGMCERIKRRIAGVALVSPGVYAPVWETDQAALDRLLLDLLNAHTAPERRLQLAEQWLGERPQAAAWVVDEGGSFFSDGPGSLPGAVVTLVNLTGSPATAWCGVDREATPRDLRPIPALECAVDLRALGNDTGASHVVRAHVGDWSRALPLLPMPLPASPPGVVTGLFANDLDATGLLAGGVAIAGDPGWETAAIVHRPTTDGDVAERARWEIYFECRVPVGHDRKGESLLVFTGRFGRASAGWQVGHDGSVKLATGAPNLDPAVAAMLSAQIRVIDLPDRWIARVPLPPELIEEHQLLRLGLAREDARGVRSAWPRPLTPWQAEPSRACLDLSAWGH